MACVLRSAAASDLPFVPDAGRGSGAGPERLFRQDSPYLPNPGEARVRQLQELAGTEEAQRPREEARWRPEEDGDVRRRAARARLWPDARQRAAPRAALVAPGCGRDVDQDRERAA